MLHLRTVLHCINGQDEYFPVEQVQSFINCSLRIIVTFEKIMNNFIIRAYTSESECHIKN